MLRLLTLLLLFTVGIVSAQTPTTYSLRYDTVKVEKSTGNGNAELILKNGTRNVQGYLYNVGDGKTVFRQLTAGDISGSLAFDATKPSTSPIAGLTGVTLGTTTLGATLQALIYPSQPPTATISGGQQLELMASGANLPYSLNWSAGRNASTQSLSSITVAGVNQTFTNPSAPGTVSGTQAVSVPRNVNTTFQNIVTTSDSKTATSSTSFTFSPKRYWGRTSSHSIQDATIIASAGGGSEFTSSKAKGSFSVTASGASFIYFAYPASYGALTSLSIGGFESLPAFTQYTVSHANASGHIQNYLVYISNNTFSGNATNIVTQ